VGVNNLKIRKNDDIFSFLFYSSTVYFQMKPTIDKQNFYEKKIFFLNKEK